MKIKEVEFVKSSSCELECPKSDLLEFAFIGRSNVGKSSMINELSMRKSLAKVSSTPGKTQLINHFIVNDSWYLVDLPGYGWARLSKAKKVSLDKMVRDYLLIRKKLASVFVLIDSRLKPQPIDLDFINWLGRSHIPISIIFTKVDKKSSIKRSVLSRIYSDKILVHWESLPKYFFTSSKTGEGLDEVRKYIREILELF